MMNTLLNTAIIAGIEAGKAILKIYYSDKLDIEIKADSSPLTIADKVSHNIISSHLLKTNIPILSEEGKEVNYTDRKNWKQLWIVDPIDGTKEFIKKNGEFTVNIALIKNQKPILGVIFVPDTGVLYFSTKELGSYKVIVDLKDFDYQILISNAIKLPLKRQENKFTVVVSRSHRSKETEKFIKKIKDIHGDVKLISRGSSLKLCMVAEGNADCYPRFTPSMEWDTAAGQAICEHAGFKVVDMKTNDLMVYNRKELLNNSFLVN